jgi:two-component sensor histidine kinase
VFDTRIGDETEHTAIGEVELVILVSAPLADVVRHSFQTRDASMHDSIIDNNGLRENLELMEKRLQSLAEYQQMLSFAMLNSKIDNLHQAINQQMNTTGNLHHSKVEHVPVVFVDRKEVVSATMVLVDT